MFAWCRCYFLFQSEHVVLIYSWNVSLVKSGWERAHIEFNLWSVYYMFYMLVPTLPWCKLDPVPTAVLIVTMISIRAHLVLRRTVSIGNRFPWLYINCFQSPWFQCMIIEPGIFPWWVVLRGGGDWILGGVDKEGDIKKVDEKRKEGWYTLPHYVDTPANQLFQLQDLSKTFTNNSLHKLLSR